MNVHVPEAWNEILSAAVDHGRTARYCRTMRDAQDSITANDHSHIARKRSVAGLNDGDVRDRKFSCRAGVGEHESDNEAYKDLNAVAAHAAPPRALTLRKAPWLTHRSYL